MFFRQVINGILIFLAFVFLVLGLIGLALPVIPQVPFLCASLFCAASGSKRFKNWFKNHKFYKKYLLPIVKKYKILSVLFNEEWNGKNDSEKSENSEESEENPKQIQKTKAS